MPPLHPGRRKGLPENNLNMTGS